MRLLHWSRPLLTTALVLVGFHSSHASTPTSALSYLKPAGTQRCEWVRQPLPSGAPVTVLSFESSCDRAELFWSPDGKRGLVFTRQDTPPRLWLVDFASKKSKPLEFKGIHGEGAQKPGPTRLSLLRAGFDAQGRPVALIGVIFTKGAQLKDKEKSFTFEGRSYPMPRTEGVPGMAQAYRLEGSEWKRFESQVSTFEAEKAPGVDVLAAAKALSGPSPAAPSEEQKKLVTAPDAVSVTLWPSEPASR